MFAPRVIEPLLSLSRVVFYRDCQGIAQDTIPFGKGDTVLFEICSVFFGSKVAVTRLVYAYNAYIASSAYATTRLSRAES